MQKLLSKKQFKMAAAIVLLALSTSTTVLAVQHRLPTAQEVIMYMERETQEQIKFSPNLRPQTQLKQTTTKFSPQSSLK